MKEEIVKTKVVAKLADGQYIKRLPGHSLSCGGWPMTTTENLLEALDFSSERFDYSEIMKKNLATPVRVCIQMTVTDELVEIGRFSEPPGPIGMAIPVPFYGIRYNQNFAHMSTKPLGWQVLIDGVVGFRWINVESHWIHECPAKDEVSKSLIN